MDRRFHIMQDGSADNPPRIFELELSEALVTAIRK